MQANLLHIGEHILSHGTARTSPNSPPCDMWSRLPPELVSRISFFAPRDGSALRWCSICHSLLSAFRAAQPTVHALLLGDYASIISNPLMQSCILSVDVLNELVVNLPATYLYADAGASLN